jgi:uncharacterized membrane protein (UPF0136 family)
MKFSAIAILLYAFLILIGGVVEYLQAKSLYSLISGFIFGTSLLISGWFAWHESMTAGYIATLTILLLAIYFGYKFILTEKFLPSGIILIASFITLFFLLLSLFSRTQE